MSRSRAIPKPTLPTLTELLAQWRARPTVIGTFRVLLPVSYGQRARSITPTASS